ncbi:hypothetical protein CHL67_07540 [Prosthecochloris sp. GSB1]|uniref:MBL fold metallo-hydrolase n=1 Tax=Prosthecochloris sp. GSB1 TaxID=281093 RepID=UPI000B8CE717|nr:MBL fold metallo-hydrolase [Prosthecochloris sp. GSB1]ASQ90791.1 hypothetical protein CHL67_07540 [Prosthecochloris sp. GSB1]
MNLTVIYDNTAFRPGLASGWGFSVLVDDTILFDAGCDGPGLTGNLEKLGRSPSGLDAVVLSHNHGDHTGGLETVLELKPGLPVHVCPDAGADLEERIAAAGGRVVRTSPGMTIRKGIRTTGSIPAAYKGGPMPEQALVLDTPSGTSVVTGCSHPGLGTILEEASRISESASFRMVLGGFHWRDFSPGEAEREALGLERWNIGEIAPLHCSGEPARTALEKLRKNGTVHGGSGFDCTV